MARRASRAGQAVVAVYVTQRARRCRMNPGEREPGRRMIKRAIAPGRRRMAHRAVGRELRLQVVGVAGAVVIRHVAGVAGPAGQVVVAVNVALRAGQACVAASQGKPNGIVIKIRGLPGARVMACLAGLRKVECQVVRVRGFLIIRQMAGHAVCRRVFEMVLHVARRALKRGVHSGQCEAGVFQMIKAHAEPVVESMALLARG